jgi:hypothetical protein
MSDPSPSAGPGGATVYGSPGANPRQRGTLRLAAPFLAGALAAGWLLRTALPHPDIPARWAGFGLVLLAASLAAIALHMRRRRLDFLRGARGEEETARILSGLAAGAHVFHGMAVPRGGVAAGDIDHAVVSPRGVFVVETLNWSGQASIAGDQLLYDGCLPDRDPVDRVRRAASALRERLRASGVDTHVQPVLCLPRAALRAESEGVAGVVVCRQQALPHVLAESTETPLDPATVQRAAAVLRSLTED